MSCNSDDRDGAAQENRDKEMRWEKDGGFTRRWWFKKPFEHLCRMHAKMYLTVMNKGCNGLQSLSNI